MPYNFEMTGIVEVYKYTLFFYPIYPIKLQFSHLIGKQSLFPPYNMSLIS